MNASQSRYVEKKGYLSRYAPEGTLSLRQAAARQVLAAADSPEWLRSIRQDLPRYLPFLTGKCGVDFRGRILEIGAGSAWLSAELSKLPRVVEVFATDFLPLFLQELAPKVFQILGAKTAKITRLPADYHELDFPDNHFDFVVCSCVLHNAANIVQVLREAKRVLKPGGQLVAIREPVWPLVKLKSRAKMLSRLVRTGVNERHYSLSDYKEFFLQAGLPLRVKRVNLASGFKFYLNEMVNGLTHARYAFIGTKRAPAAAPKAPSGSWKGNAR